MSGLDEVADGVFRWRDSCMVYLIVDGAGGGVLIDFGSGDVLDRLDEVGVRHVDAVLMTHHHRDQGQGLARAVEAGIPIVVPTVEQDLFARVDEMWAARPLANDYNLRQDRFSLLEPVPVAALAAEYRTRQYGRITVRAIPTPGHTMGSVSYLVERPEGLLAFTGDLIYAPGKVWSLAATQWSYTESEGPAMTVLSAELLRREHPTLLLPSHGEPIAQPDAALSALRDRMQRYVDSRRLEPWDLIDRLDHPFVRITEHLLVNRSANSCSYVLLSGDGHALLIDYGYDMTTGWPAGTDRAARLPWLASLPVLTRDFGVQRIEVVLGTHYHDDHVAGFNLLRDVEGTEVWLPEHVAPILAEPLRTDLPCQWFDPIPADRVLPLGGTVQWRGYSITTHDLPGHTRYQAGFEFEVDGVRVLATGDQQTGEGQPGVRGDILNYQYRNRFRAGDFRLSGELYQRVAPGLMATGHWKGRWVDQDYLDLLSRQGRELERMHAELLPEQGTWPAADGNLALLEPFHRTVGLGETVHYRVLVHCEKTAEGASTEVRVSLVVPRLWGAHPAEVRAQLDPEGNAVAEFAVTVTTAGKRQRLAADVSVGETRFGQQADAVIDVLAD